MLILIMMAQYVSCVNENDIVTVVYRAIVCIDELEGTHFAKLY